MKKAFCSLLHVNFSVKWRSIIDQWPTTENRRCKKKWIERKTEQCALSSLVCNCWLIAMSFFLFSFLHHQIVFCVFRFFLQFRLRPRKKTFNDSSHIYIHCMKYKRFSLISWCLGFSSFSNHLRAISFYAGTRKKK